MLRSRFQLYSTRAVSVHQPVLLSMVDCKRPSSPMGGSDLSSEGGEAIPPVSCSSVDSLAASETFDLGSDHDEARLKRMQLAVRALLTGLGEDVDREGLIDTPKVIYSPLSDFVVLRRATQHHVAWYTFKWWSVAFVV